MPFRVVTATTRTESGEMVSSALASVDAALEFAAALIADGDTVLRIEDGAGVVVRTREEVETWCAGRNGPVAGI